MPHSPTLRFVPAAVVLVLVLGSAAAAGHQEKPRAADDARVGHLLDVGSVLSSPRRALDAACALARSEVPIAGDAGCAFEDEIAIEPPTAVVPGEDEPPLATFEVEARDLWFSPAELTVSGSGSSTIRLENAGRVVHNLTVDELGIVIVVTAGGAGAAIVADVRPGTYAFYCSISGHREAGMEGVLTIQ